jgi:hypothetical protein
LWKASQPTCCHPRFSKKKTAESESVSVPAWFWPRSRVGDADDTNPATEGTGDAGNVAEEFVPPGASTTALSEIADNPLATYFETAAQDSFMGFDRACLDGWFLGMAAADPYSEASVLQVRTVKIRL